MLASNVEKSRDKQYSPHEPLVREAPLVVGTSEGFTTSRPSHVDDDEPILQPIHTMSKYTDPHAPKPGEQVK
jgi:hypothetical protein